MTIKKTTDTNTDVIQEYFIIIMWLVCINYTVSDTIWVSVWRKKL